MFLVIKETREDTSSQFYDVFTSIQIGVIDYMTTIRKLEINYYLKVKLQTRTRRRKLHRDMLIKAYRK